MTPIPWAPRCRIMKSTGLALQITTYGNLVCMDGKSKIKRLFFLRARKLLLQEVSKKMRQELYG